MMMIHNPATIAMGDHSEMQKAIDQLFEVKESIINAYEIKTGLSRAKISHLMDEETWMNANKALELGFIDEIIGENTADNAVIFSEKTAVNSLVNKIENRIAKPNERSVNDIRERLDLMKKFI